MLIDVSMYSAAMMHILLHEYIEKKPQLALAVYLGKPPMTRHTALHNNVCANRHYEFPLLAFSPCTGRPG